jgi:hypothetical protein
MSLRQHPLRCQCGACDLPFATVQAGVLVIISRHGGDKHTNVLRLEDVERLLAESKQTPVRLELVGVPV